MYFLYVCFGRVGVVWGKVVLFVELLFVINLFGFLEKLGGFGVGVGGCIKVFCRWMF